MKFPLAILLMASLPVFAQENSTPNDEASSSVAVSEVSTEIATDSDSEVIPTPTLGILPQDIRDTTVRELDDQKFIFQRVQPIELAPPPAESPLAQPLTSGELAAAAAARAKSKFLFIGASVYSAEDSPEKYRTLVRYWPEQGGEEMVFWSSANFLFLGGFASFENGEGDNRISYSLMLSASDFHTESFMNLAGKKPFWDIPTNIPEFADGNATFIVVHGNPTAEQLAPIQALHDLYNSRKDEFEAAYRARVEYALEREAYLKAHPPEKKNLVFHHWRVDDPGKAQEAAAAQQKEGQQ